MEEDDRYSEEDKKRQRLEVIRQQNLCEYGKDIISSLNLKPNQTFLVNKYKMQAGYFKQEELEQILQKLRDVDYQYKNGLIDLQVGMESILCAYCSK